MINSLNQCFIPSFLLRPKLSPVAVVYGEGLSEGAEEGKGGE
jgi:hypothetical protein